MKDARPLVQFMYEMQVEDYLRQMRTNYYPSIDADLFNSLYHEATVKLPDHPLHNQYINRYNHFEDDWRTRPRDVTRIYFPSRVYHFRYMSEAVVLENHLSAAAQTPNCTMFIWIDPDLIPEARDMLLVCSEISNQQPVTALYMHDVTCNDSSLTAPRMNNPQVLKLSFCDLPTNFVENLIQQLKGSGDSLQKLQLSYMNLRPYESLLDELLENLVAHHETHKGQRKLELKLWGGEEDPTNLSEGFRVKWRERCEGVESIHCEIDDY